MKKFSATILIIVIFFYLLVEFIGDRLIKNIFENNISSTLNRDVKIEKLNINQCLTWLAFEKEKNDLEKQMIKNARQNKNY